MIVWAGDAAAGEARSRRSGRSPRRIADLVHPLGLPGDVPPEDESYHPTAAGRTMFIDRIGVADGEDDRRAADRVRRDAPRVADPGPRRGDGTRAATRPPSLTVEAGSWSTSRRSTRGTTTVGSRRRGSSSSSRTRQGDGGAYVNFLTDEGDASRPGGLPGRHVDRLAAIKRRYDRRTCSGATERPAEPGVSGASGVIDTPLRALGLEKDPLQTKSPAIRTNAMKISCAAASSRSCARRCRPTGRPRRRDRRCRRRHRHRRRGDFRALTDPVAVLDHARIIHGTQGLPGRA